MRVRARRRGHGERGQSLVLMTLFLFVMLGMLAMVLDVGHGYLMKRRLQAAVDLGSVAAAQFRRTRPPRRPRASTTSSETPTAARGRHRR
jgi:Flp pilus assembly protein TadG